MRAALRRPRYRRRDGLRRAVWRVSQARDNFALDQPGDAERHQADGFDGEENPRRILDASGLPVQRVRAFARHRDDHDPRAHFVDHIAAELLIGHWPRRGVRLHEEPTAHVREQEEERRRGAVVNSCRPLDGHVEQTHDRKGRLVRHCRDLDWTGAGGKTRDEQSRDAGNDGDGWIVLVTHVANQEHSGEAEQTDEEVSNVRVVVCTDRLLQGRRPERPDDDREQYSQETDQSSELLVRDGGYFTRRLDAHEIPPTEDGDEARLPPPWQA